MIRPAATAPVLSNSGSSCSENEPLFSERCRCLIDGQAGEVGNRRVVAVLPTGRRRRSSCGVTVSPAFRPGWSGTIQLTTMPSGNRLVEHRIGCCKHEVQRGESRCRLVERHADEIGKWSRRRTGADDELEGLVLFERRRLARLGPDDDP